MTQKLHQFYKYFVTSIEDSSYSHRISLPKHMLNSTLNLTATETGCHSQFEYQVLTYFIAMDPIKSRSY